MRIVHPETIPTLPRGLLLGLHRDLCRIRGVAWGHGRKLQWLWNLPISTLAWYHRQVVTEMYSRGYEPNGKWLVAEYRGKKIEPVKKGWASSPNVTDKRRMTCFCENFPETKEDSEKYLASWIESHGGEPCCDR